MPVSTDVAPPRRRLGRAARWAIGLSVATVLGLSAVAVLGVGLVVAIAQSWAGVNLTARATATVVAVEPREGYTEAEVTFHADGTERRATLESDTPIAVGQQLVVAYNPDVLGRVRPATEVADAADHWSAGWHPQLWIFAGVGLLHLGTAAVAITAILALKAPPRPRRRPLPRPPPPSG